LVRLAPEKQFHYGDRLQLHGTVETPPEAEVFSYNEYLSRQDIYSPLGYGKATLIERRQGNPFRSAIYKVKEKALEITYQL